MKNTHDYIDTFKRRSANAVLHAVDITVVRQRSLENLARWEAAGTWVSAHDEWRNLMINGTDAEVIAAMTGRDQDSNRLRQSSPYPGIIDDVTRAYLWETRKVEADADVPQAYSTVDAEILKQAKFLLHRFEVTVLRKNGLSFVERLHLHAGSVSRTHEEWRKLLTAGSDNEIIAVMGGEDDRAKHMRLVHPFMDLL